MNNILKLAKSVAKKYNTNDPFELCAAMDISLHMVVLPKGINGFYNTVLGIPFIYLDCELNHREQRAVCAHELGHMFLHPRLNTLFIRTKTIINSDKLEREADLFAAALLIPSIIHNDEYAITTRHLAYEWDVPERLVEARMRIG